MSPSFIQYFVPSNGVIAIETEAGAWSWIRPAGLSSLFRKVTAEVKPYGTPRFTRATLGGERLSDPASYSRLFTLQGATDDFPSEPDWLPFAFTSARPSPWTTNAATLEYSPSTNTLWRGVEYIKLSNRLAGNVEHHRSFAAAGGSGGGFPWLPLLVSLVAAGVLGGALFVIRARRPEPPPVSGPAPLPE
jgi:hypothetical protein